LSYQDEQDKAKVIAAVAQLQGTDSMGAYETDIASAAGLGGSSQAERILRELQQNGAVHYTNGGRWKVGPS
jgi:DNA-binding IclR family transcriptional regulator